jgi:hypothetical protein
MSTEQQKVKSDRNKVILKKKDCLNQIKTKNKEGFNNVRRDIYNDRKEAIKMERIWQYEKDLEETLLDAEYDAEVEIAEEFNKSLENFYAQLDAEDESRQQALLECDDIVDVDFKSIEAPKRKERKSLLGSNSNKFLLASSSETDNNKPNLPKKSGTPFDKLG